MRNSDCAAKALIDRQSGELIGICTFTAYSLERQRVSGVLQGSQPSEIGVVRLVMLGERGSIKSGALVRTYYVIFLNM
ncbi:toxin-antitoxin system, toxin component, GNAT family [Shigella flexneri K-404]|nr:toxin-antitoxin system, toxin component, GNAT family [Shigella flexneri K-404]